MASVLPEAPVGAATHEVVEALNGLGVGIVTLGHVRDTVSKALGADAGALPAIQAIVEGAFHAGRLAPDDYQALAVDLGLGPHEDPPTEWSEDAVKEAAPTSDTARPMQPVPDPDHPHDHQAGLYPGAVLRNRFVLQSRLKTSDMNEVFKALDRRRQEAGDADPWVAIKLVTPGARHYAAALKLLQQEAALSQRLHHPHIVRVFDFDRDEDYAFLTMEWLQGESLGELLTRQRYRPMTPAHARQILTEIGDALEFAHSRGVTHADVKPGNIFLTTDAMAKLLDFGIARSAADAAAGSGAEARTPGYASCEVLEGAAPTPQDDVYSLACVAYRMLAGRRAFGHHDALAAERAGRKPSPIRTLGSSQWAALERGLAFRRAARTPDMATFMQDFNAAAPAAYAPIATIAPAQPTTPRTEPPDAATSRNPLWMGMAAGVAMLVVTAGLWLRPDADESTPAAPVAANPAPASGSVPETRDAPPDGGRAAAEATPPAPQSKAAPAPAPKPARKTETRTARGTPAAAPKRQPRSEPRQMPALAAAPASGDDARPIPADQVAVNGSLLAAAELPASPAPAQPTGAPGLAATPTAEGANAPSLSGRAAAVPREILLSDLRFTRYVEPKDKRARNSPAGWVELAFTVGTKGEPRDITVVDASPPGRYEEVALAAVRRWRFEPPREGGAAVERRTGVRLRFQPE